jgi:hypothetical protein
VIHFHQRTKQKLAVALYAVLKILCTPLLSNNKNMGIAINRIVKLFEDLEYVIQGYPGYVNNLDFIAVELREIKL